jgi:tryptophan 2,3-dioxygenase
MEALLEQIQHKYRHLGQDPQTYLKGLLHMRPLTYWDYIQVDTLLSLQRPRTNFPDEVVFIVYHQITELMLKLVRHELDQLTTGPLPSAEVFEEKTQRLVRYTRLLIMSFSIMNQGMRSEEYSQFRLALAPASGFQSAQFRYIELQCTSLENLVPPHRRSALRPDLSWEEKFQLLYWQDAGYDPVTGKKSLTLQEFEDHYLTSLIEMARRMENDNLYRRYLDLARRGEDGDHLRAALRLFDYTFNVSWPLVHLQTAHTYLGSGHEETAATGGSHWEKYLHPKYQKRIFFPALWTEVEQARWGEVEVHAGAGAV